MSRIAAGVVFCAVAAPSLAEEQVPAPDYFVATVMETSTAQLLAVHCPTLSIDPVKVARRTEDVLERLSDDGFTPDNLQTRMLDPADQISAMQADFMTKHGLSDGAASETVCAAGQAEIAEETTIGTLLLEVSQ